MASISGGVTTGFLYDGANVVQDLSGGNPSANLLTGRIDEVFARTDTSTRNFLADGLGNTVALTDQTGTVATQYSYEPFGNTSSTGSSSSNSLQYTGRENDGTGLYFYRARYYSPVQQRFVGQNPLGFGGGEANLYAYASNAPADHKDSLGQTAYPGTNCAGCRRQRGFPPAFSPDPSEAVQYSKCTRANA